MRKSRSIQLDHITMGVCYYPEHWDETLWQSDLDRMLQTGIEVIRVAEFAWSKFEPEEGVFTFDFFDRFLRVVEKTPMKVIFCTPTATPPAWATHNYPDILNCTKEGVPYRHGLRRHYNYNSAKYQQLAQSIVGQLAAHYGSHPSIIGWQIDNEINCETNEFYSASDSLQFRVFLREKYGTIDALNKAWGTVFWNQDYNSWEQVFVPRPTVNNGEVNPHQQLDYYRFVSHSACRFVGMQAQILRSVLPSQVFITTNGLFSNVDNHRQTAENLDFMTYDSYPNFAFDLYADPRHSSDLNDRKWSRNLTETRSISPQFGIMEQQSGPNGWTYRLEAPSPKPGQMTLWTMQSVAHGADFISYFRWRTCTVGTEIYWHGILDYDNRDNRRLREAASISDMFAKLSPLAGATYQAAFAVIKEYDNIWDAQHDRWHGRVDSESAAGWFRAAQLTHTPMNFLYITERSTLEELCAYPLLVYPHATILSERTANLLQEYVAQGGKLVIGCRTGYKDTNGRCCMTPQPGLLANLCGAEVADFTFVGPNDDTVYADWDGDALEASIFNDILTPLDGAEVLATYTSNYYKGAPALVRNRCGKGETYYFGAAFCQKTAAVFLQKLGIATPWKETVSLPTECEIAVRQNGDNAWLFVLNYAGSETAISLHRPLLDVLQEKTDEGTVTLPPYGVKVYQL